KRARYPSSVSRLVYSPTWVIERGEKYNLVICAKVRKRYVYAACTMCSSRSDTVRSCFAMVPPGLCYDELSFICTRRRDEWGGAGCGGRCGEGVVSGRFLVIGT